MGKKGWTENRHIEFRVNKSIYTKARWLLDGDKVEVLNLILHLIFIDHLVDTSHCERHIEKKENLGCLPSRSLQSKEEEDV